jgi:hypothetical protein
VRRNLRALALAAVGGLLLLAPVSTAFATSDVYVTKIPYGGSQATPWSVVFRETMLSRMTDRLDAGEEPPVPGFDRETQTLDGSRYDGKTIPG